MIRILRFSIINTQAYNKFFISELTFEVPIKTSTVIFLPGFAIFFQVFAPKPPVLGEGEPVELCVIQCVDDGLMSVS